MSAINTLTPEWVLSVGVAHAAGLLDTCRDTRTGEFEKEGVRRASALRVKSTFRGSLWHLRRAGLSAK